MVLKAKQKGTAFENLAVDILNKLVKGSRWKRIPGSGAIGTILDEPFLQGDIMGSVDSISKPFRIEAKVGYGGATQLTLKKEWFDKIAEESGRSNAIPLVMGKFSGSRSGTKIFVAMDVETFAQLINTTTELYEEVEKHESGRI